MLVDPGVLHCDSCAKNAVAFFRISRSSSARLSARFSRFFSSRSFQRGPWAGLARFATMPAKPLPQARLAYADSAGSCGDRVLLLGDELYRTPLELV